VARQGIAYSSAQLRVRATLPITPEMSRFLRGLSDRCKDEDGRFMDRSVILRSLIRALIKLEKQVDWSNIQSEDELAARLVKAFSRK
jgi:hypothetical protein